MGKKWLAKQIMKRLSHEKSSVISLECNTDYALMLLGMSYSNFTFDKNNVSARNAVKAEKILLQSLKEASEKDIDYEMIRAAKALECLYQAAGHYEEAAQVNHLYTGLETKKYYERLGL